MKSALIIAILISAFALSGCAMGGPVGQNQPYQPFPGQGQYVRPDYMNAVPPPRIPEDDTCDARMFQTLVGVHEGGIYIPGLPGSKRIVRPATFEGPENDFLNGEMMGDTYVQVQLYQAGQQLYAPTISNVRDRMTIRPEIETRLTITLNREGYVEEIACG